MPLGVGPGCPTDACVAWLPVYLCAAFLQRWSAELRKKPFNEMFMFLQALPTQDWGEAEVEDLLSQAFVLHSLFASAPKHLQQ